jgi:hypothetical protein
MWLQQMFAWLNVLVYAGGAVVCGLQLGRSRWAGLLTGAFVVETTVLAYYQLAILATSSGLVNVRLLGAVSAFASLVGLGARIGIVWGLSGLLTDAGRASTGAPVSPSAGV